MTLRQAIKEGYAIKKERAGVKYKKDFFISANKMISFRNMYKQELRKIGLSDNFSLEFGRLYNTIALVELNDKKDWKRYFK